MATLTDPRPNFRVIAFNAALVGKLRTVNVVATDPANGTERHRGHNGSQITAAQTQVGIHKTVMAAASVTPGLPTVFISGYTAPN